MDTMVSEVITRIRISTDTNGVLKVNSVCAKTMHEREMKRGRDGQREREGNVEKERKRLETVMIDSDLTIAKKCVCVKMCEC